MYPKKQMEYYKKKVDGCKIVDQVNEYMFVSYPNSIERNVHWESDIKIYENTRKRVSRVVSRVYRELLWHTRKDK